MDISSLIEQHLSSVCESLGQMPRHIRTHRNEGERLSKNTRVLFFIFTRILSHFPHSQAVLPSCPTTLQSFVTCKTTNLLRAKTIFYFSSISHYNSLSIADVNYVLCSFRKNVTFFLFHLFSNMLDEFMKFFGCW